MKRVLSIQPAADRGGSNHALLQMVRSLAADGWTCHIAVPGPSPMADEYLAAGASIHVVAMRRLTTSGRPARWLAYVLAWPVSVCRLALLARRVRADVIHTNSLHSLYGWAAACLLRKPHVWHAREIVHQSPAALRLERWLAGRFAARVVAVSGAVARQLEPANVVIVVDEPEPGRFEPGRSGVFRARAGIPDGTPLLGAVGRVDTWKGFDVLLDAVPAIQAARPGTEVVVAGGPVVDKEAYCRRLAARAGELPGVHWLGPRTDVPDLMADLDVFVLASTEPEPFGLVVVEALACGVPVVVTDAGGPPEILGQAVPGAGRLVPPGDPAALARAAVAMLPPGPSSTARRRARAPLRSRPPPRFGALFDAVVAGPPQGVGCRRPGGLSRAVTGRRPRDSG
jgi:glycosyltransferase involved in cell wall biosynthesis